MDRAVGRENYAEAKKLADTILQRGAPDDRQKTLLVYGRILLGLGQKDQTRQYLKLLSNSGAAGQVKVYAAWLQALDGKPEEAIATLEQVLERAASSPHDTDADAADVLAMLYMARGESAKAKKAVEFGLAALKYQDITQGYLLALLRGRLNSKFVAGQAERLYHAAEKLRQQEKFVEAGLLFAQVYPMYGNVPSPSSRGGSEVEPAPASQYGHLSGFRIGQCYVGLDRLPQAIDWWQKFIDQSPAGPWRGQAYVAMVDATLESRLDLAKATEQTRAAGALLDQQLEKEDDSSWHEAAYGIRLRYGVVSLAAGRMEAAADALRQAKESAPRSMSPEVQSGLDRLIETAESQSRVLPDDVAVGDDRATAAITLGNVYMVLRQYDAAGRYFSLPLKGPLRSQSAAHRSFAGLGLARVVVATAGNESEGKSPVRFAWTQATTAYQASLKEYPASSWHDETLRELALLIERAATEPSTPPVTDAESTQPPAPPMSEAARQQEKKALVAARAAALPHWLDLPSRYPASRHVPQALYHAGVLYSEAEKPAEALAVFEELAKKHPDSAWAGDGHVRLIDVKLEQQFDLPGARQHANSAIDWYEHLDQAKAAQARKGLGDQSDALRSLKQVGYDIYVRAGLVEYLLEHPEGAVRFFEKATPLQPERDFIVVQGHIPTGIERLIEAAKSGKSLTPDIVRQGDEKARLILVLADVYHEGQLYEKSLDLCARVIAGAAPHASREQQSYAYFRRARNHYLIAGSAFDPHASLADYVAAVNAAPKVPWADSAMFFAGNIEWNHNQNAAAAIAVWNRLLREYPTSSEADRSTFFIGLALYFTEQYPRAQKALEHYLASYPASEFADSAREVLRQCNAKLYEIEKASKQVRGKAIGADR